MSRILTKLSTFRICSFRFKIVKGNIHLWINQAQLLNLQ